jgi:shikimate dehydrogenase
LQPGRSIRVAAAGTISNQPPRLAGARRHVGELSRWTLAEREDVVKRSHALFPTQEPPPAGAQIVAFLGVTTRASSITRIFPARARACDLNLELGCVDLPLGSPAGSYRALATQLLEDPSGLGMVITSHKRAMYEAVADLVVASDPYARAGREVSPLLATDGGLVADAGDPRTVRLVLGELLGPRHWQDTAADALVLGSGGAGIAIALTLLTHRVGQVLAGAEQQPRRLVVTDISAQRAAAARELLQPLAGTSELEARTADREQTTRLLETLPPASLVVNATGMGKDTPGSPIAPGAVFPEGARVLDANYRGARPFLRRAHAQAASRRLVVRDGWRYFVHGWTQALAPMVPGGVGRERVTRFETIANADRRGTQP